MDCLSPRTQRFRKDMYDPMNAIINAITEAVADHTGRKALLHFFTDGTHSLYSERKDSCHPDGYQKLNLSTLPDHPNTETCPGWPDVAVPFDFKRRDSHPDADDLSGQCIISCEVTLAVVSRLDLQLRPRSCAFGTRIAQSSWRPPSSMFQLIWMHLSAFLPAWVCVRRLSLDMTPPLDA